MLLRPLFYGLALFLPFVLAAAPLPLRQLTEPRSLAIPRVSLDGKRIALRVEIDGVQYLALMDLDTTKLKLVAKFETTKLRNLFWKGENFLLLVVENPDGSSEMRSYDMQSQQVEFLAEKMRFSWVHLRSLLPNDPEQVVVEVNSYNGTYLGRLNLRTGKVTVIEKARSSVLAWYTNTRGEPVAALWNEDKKQYLRWRPTANAPWQLTEIGPEEEPRSLVPFGVHVDQRRILAWDSRTGPTTSIVALDPATLATEALFRHPRFDPRSIRYWGDDPSALVAITYLDDVDRFQFLNPDAARIQGIIDASLPGNVNTVISVSQDQNVAAIESISARDSGVIYVMDLSKKKLLAVGPLYAYRDPASMGTSHVFDFVSKDGLPIRGRVLLPVGGQPHPPAILFVGGDLAGPQSNPNFDPIQQAFASRGYAVVRIDVRGSDGYGREFIRRGGYQFATGMIDDLYLGLDHLVARGLIDGERLGLLTTDRGGVIGLQALTRANRFKVWLNVNTDLSVNPIGAEELALWPRKPAEIAMDLGGKQAVKAMMRSLDPENLLPSLHIPSFHAYRRERLHGIHQNSTFVRRHLPANTPSEVVDYDLSDKPDFTRSEVERAWSRLFDFLGKTMPVP